MLRCAALVKNFDFVFLLSVRRLLFTANVVPSSPILVTAMMEAPSSSETLFCQTQNYGVFWDVIPCDSCNNRRFGGT
jgi:hypothetical protein